MYPRQRQKQRYRNTGNHVDTDVRVVTKYLYKLGITTYNKFVMPILIGNFADESVNGGKS